MPTSRADENAAIVKPLGEIGRVRARTPYCAALARARAGIDAAISFEYNVPVVANDLRFFRLDSNLSRFKALRKTERDLSALYDLALEGRDEVRALRVAAKADGVDEQRRKEMIDFANALDGAKGRQIVLAKKMAYVVGTLAEAPIRDITKQPYDDDGARAFTRAADPLRPSETGDAVIDNQGLRRLFGVYIEEEFIRDDLKNAAAHGNKAMQLGGCSGA